MQNRIRTTFVAWLAALTLHAAEKPTVDSVLDRHVKEIGGKEAVEKVKTLRYEGEFRIGEIAAPMESARKAPAKTGWKIKLDGVTYAQAHDGEKGWKQDPNGVQSLDERELRALKRNGAIHGEIRMKELFPNLQYKGTEKLRGEEVHILESKRPEVSSRLAFSTNTGLLVSSTVHDGDFKTVSHLSNYKKVDGVLRPHTVEETISSSDGELEFTVEFKRITTNGEVKDDFFARPKS